MLAELSFTEARSRFTEVVDRAQKYVPTVIKPRKRSEDGSIVVRLDFIKSLLNKDVITYDFTTRFIKESDTSITCVVDPFGIVVNGKTREEVADLAVEDMIEYAQEYMDEKNLMLYFNSPNRRSHIGMVLRVLLCDSKDEVKRLLNLA